MPPAGNPGERLPACRGGHGRARPRGSGGKGHVTHLRGETPCGEALAFHFLPGSARFTPDTCSRLRINRPLTRPVVRLKTPGVVPRVVGAVPVAFLVAGGLRVVCGVEGSGRQERGLGDAPLAVPGLP